MKQLSRLFFSIALLFAVCATSDAVPAKRVLQQLKQSDGTTVTIMPIGDEWRHGFATTDGLTVNLVNGNAYYCVAGKQSDVLAHDLADRSQAEQDFINANKQQMRLDAQTSDAPRRVKAAAPMKATQVPTSGTPKVPILLVEYKDKAMSNDSAAFVKHYTSGDKSVYQYFYDQSNGLYKPEFDVWGIYTLSGNRELYGGNVNGQDQGVGTMVGEAVDMAAKAGVDFSQYDNDGDGYCDVVIVVYAGVGEAQASNTVPESVWPCQWSLSSAKYYSDGKGVRTYNNTKVDKFAVFNEVRGSRDSGTTLDGIGTFCHEFSHCLGLPDFYETTYDYGYYGMGNWSLMNSGCYNDEGDTPVGYSAYEKNFMGWIDLINPVPNTQYTLAAMNSGTAANDQAIKIVSDLNADEYFILENRKQQGWDEFIPDEGLLIHHYTYIASRWQANTVNNEAIQLATLMPADNSLSESNENLDCWPYTSGRLKNTAFTNTSKPASTLNLNADGTLASSTGGAGSLGKPVTEIVLNDDGTVTFWYDKGNTTAVNAIEVDEIAEDDVIYTLQGIRISNRNQLTKGIYIVNGKKTVIQ